MQFSLLDLSPNFPIRVGIGMNIDVGLSRLDERQQISNRFSLEVTRQVFIRDASL